MTTQETISEIEGILYDIIDCMDLNINQYNELVSKINKLRFEPQDD